MQIELSPPPTKEKDKDEKWWGTEEVRASWMEFLETNKTLNFKYIMENQPFNELPWQYFPDPVIGHRPPIFIYGFPLDDDLSEIDRIVHSAGILKPEEPFTGHNVTSVFLATEGYLKKECGLSQKFSLTICGCHCRSARFILQLYTNYRPDRIPPEKLEYVTEVIKRHLPGKEPQWYLDSSVVDTDRRNYEIPVEALLSL